VRKIVVLYMPSTKLECVYSPDEARQMSSPL